MQGEGARRNYNKAKAGLRCKLEPQQSPCRTQMEVEHGLAQVRDCECWLEAGFSEFLLSSFLSFFLFFLLSFFLSFFLLVFLFFFSFCLSFCVSFLLFIFFHCLWKSIKTHRFATALKEATNICPAYLSFSVLLLRSFFVSIPLSVFFSVPIFPC